MMKYRVTHSTKYSYSDHVTLCHNVAHLLPRTTAVQTCHVSELNITPVPVVVNEWADLFGNRQASFSIQEPHNQLVVTAISEVDLAPDIAPDVTASAVSWEEAVEHIRAADDATVIDTAPYMLESGFIEYSADARQYAEASFPPGRPLVQAVEDLMHRIYADFDYVPGFSSIATPLSEVLEHRKGVCQDFAHLAIACLRMQGLAARYVSGYIETVPPEGKERLVGADASHAWFSVFVPHLGWVDFDPTNAQIPAEQHITVAWGRDYADVAPLKGVIFGGGEENELEVSVDVARI